MTKPIVVGVSPSTGSPTALRWAAAEAQLRGAPVRAVLAWRPPRAPAAPAGRPPASASGVALDPGQDAERTLHRMVSTALGNGNPIDCVTVRGTAVSALLAAAADAQLLVIGEPRPGRLASMRAGVVAPQIVQRATCPVVVLPKKADPEGSIRS
jgi:nucleotide-binding universal stress UspA family protein